MATLRGSQANEAPETNDALVQEKQDSPKTATKRTRKSKAQVTTKASQSELSSVDTAISTETTGAAVSQEDQSLDPQEQHASADGKKVRKTAKATKAKAAEAEPKAAKATKATTEAKATKATKASSKASKNSKASKVSSASTASTDSVICEDEGALADSESSKVEGTNETAKASAKNVSGALSDTCNEGQAQAQAQEPTNSDNQDGMNAEANCDVTEPELEKGKAKKTSKAAKKAKDQDDPMSKESIEAHAAKALDFNAPVLLVPIRHHSVAMGLHLPRIIDAYQPDFIAVEMPHICQDQVKHLANEKVVPPIAFFSYGTTKTIQLVPVNEDDPESALEEQEVDVGFRHIYPMLSYSPEYVALKEALKRNIEYQCIDLSSCEKDYIDYCMKKQQSQEILAQDHNQCSSDEKEFGRSSYYQELVKKSGDLSFEEFWDRNFEINALAQDTKTFLHNVYSYCYCIRKGISDEQELDMVQRELFMLKHITAAQKNHKRILVITGGMHSVALCDYLYYKKKKDKPLKFPKSKDNCFLIPYSFKATDVQSEYASGIVFPYYYHKLYQAISTSLSFGPDAKLLSGDDVGGYQAVAANSENFEYWNDPLSAICQLDTKISKAVLDEDEASAEQADQDNQADPNGQAGSGKKKKKRKKHNNAAQGSITPAGRLFDVVNTIKELGSIKDQAKIKDSETFSAKVAQVQSALGINKNKSSKQLKVSYDTTVYNEAQKEALLSFKANQEQIINACDANNFFFARKVKDYRQNKMSTALQVDCQVMLKGLASLRDKLAPSVHELIDAVKSTFIKEEYNDSHYILLNLLKALTTVPLGKVPLDVNVPPIWRDFVYKAKTFALKSDDQEVHKANIDIFKDEKNVLKGRFFAQVSYLCPGFEVDQYNRYHNANYIKRTETYTYRFTDHVVMSIIEAAEYGDTLELASEAKVKESLEQGGLSLVELCSLFKDCIDMGIERQYQRLQQLITNTIYHERNLSDIACSLDMLNSYGLIAKTTKDNQKVIEGLIKLVLKRALQVLTDTVDISDEELDKYIASLMKLDYYFNKYEYITKSYYELLFELSKDSDIGASLQGAYVSFLFKNKQITYDEFERFVDQFVYGSIIENNDCIGFFYAILKVSKASIFYRNGILQLLNAYIASLQGEEFLKVLVMLRRSFASFSKEEIYKVVTLLKKIHGIAQTKNIFEVTDAEFVQNRMYDRDMLAKMSAWLPVANILEAANLHKEQIATTGLVEQLTGQDLSRSTLLSNDKRPNLNAMSTGTGQGSGLGQAPGMVSSAGAGTSASASSGAGAGASSGAGALRGASKSLDDGGGELELNPDSL